MQEHAALIRPGSIDTIPYRGGVQAQSGVRPASPEFGSESGESSLPTPQSHVSATPQSDDESSFWSDLSDDPSAAPAGFGYPEDNQTLDNYAAECAEIADALYPCRTGPIGAVWLARQPDLMRSAAPASDSTSRAVLRSSPTCSWLRSCAYLRAGRAGGRYVGRGPPCKICRRYSMQG